MMDSYFNDITEGHCSLAHNITSKVLPKHFPTIKVMCDVFFLLLW